MCAATTRQCSVKIRRAVAVQRLDRFFHFQRIADGVSQRLIHIADERDDFALQILADVHHGLRQHARFVGRLHERARAALHIQHDGIRARRDLLAHDARCDQRRAGHAAGDIAQGVEFSIGGSQVFRLAAQHDAVFFQLLPEFGFAQIDAIARDRFQLIDRAAAERQAASRHLAHVQARRRPPTARRPG